jgi:uncharacterized membrane protein
MRIQRSVQIQLVLFCVALGYSLLHQNRMPDIVPTHWDASGKVDGYGSKWINLLVMPGVIAFMALLTAVLPKLSPKKFEIAPFESAYSTIMVILCGMMLAIHLVIVQTTLGASWDISKVMMGVMFVSFIFVGNLLGKIEPNFYMGIRTPWTLADERVWRTTHRSAAKLWVFGSAAGALMVLLGFPFWLYLSYFMVICLWPVVQSYVIYRRLNGGGGCPGGFLVVACFERLSSA